MDDILVLMHKIVLETNSSFNESQFGIFNDDEQTQLLQIWKNKNCDVQKFIEALSPDQKMRVATWVTQRTSYSKKDLIKGLKKFTSYLESSSYKKYNIYPKNKN
jgi:hypothetical protein